MARKISAFKLGLFILVCGILGTAAVVWLGASHFFEESKVYVSYFDASVRGLQKDAVINYRGVAVGRVSGIGLAPDGRLIEVIMNLKKEFKVDEELAVQLREQGLTGLRYMEIDTAPANIREMTPKFNFVPPHPVIPSYPSEIDLLKSALESIYNKLINLDVEELAAGWTQTAQTLNRILSKLETAIQPEEWRETVAAANRTLQNSAAVAERFSKSASQQKIDKGMADLAATLESTKNASEALARQMKALPPNALADMAVQWRDITKSGGEVLSNADRRLQESTVLLEQNLHQLRVLLTQMNSLVQTVKDRPNRVLISPDEPDPFKRKKP